MSAIHMVAYGVLKFEDGALLTTGRNGEIYKLVGDQMKRLDIKLHYGRKSGTEGKQRYYGNVGRPIWAVYGPLASVGTYKIRPLIGEGDYVTCCKYIAAWMDRHNIKDVIPEKGRRKKGSEPTIPTIPREVT